MRGENYAKYIGLYYWLAPRFNIFAGVCVIYNIRLLDFFLFLLLFRLNR